MRRDDVDGPAIIKGILDRYVRDEDDDAYELFAPLRELRRMAADAEYERFVKAIQRATVLIVETVDH